MPEKKRIGKIIALVVLVLVVIGGVLLLLAGKEQKPTSGKFAAIAKIGKLARNSFRKISGAIKSKSPDNAPADTKPRIAAKQIKYKMKVIREFKWNEGIDSIHKYSSNLPDAGYRQGPDGILVNDKGDIYIFDLDINGEGWGVKKYDPQGNLIKSAMGRGKPIGIDSKGNICFIDQIYDSNLTVIHTYSLPVKVTRAGFEYTFDDGKFYAMGPVSSGSKKDDQWVYYECAIYSNQLVVDKDLLKYNPSMKEESAMVQPCNEITEDLVPRFLRLKREQFSSSSHKEISSMINSLKKIERSQMVSDMWMLSIDDFNNMYWGYDTFTNYGSFKDTVRYHVAVFNEKWEFLGKIDLCNDTTFIDNRANPYEYISIQATTQATTGDIYQLCVKEEGAFLVVYRKERQ